MKRNCRFFDISRTENLKSVVGDFLKKSGLKWMLNNKNIICLWNEVVGEEIAKKTKIKGLRAGVLQVDVYSSTLKAELEQFFKESIIDSIKELDPESKVINIKFYLAEKQI